MHDPMDCDGRRFAGVSCPARPCTAEDRQGHLSQAPGPGQRGRTARPDSDVHANETVNTGNTGQANLQFVDRSNLSVGPMSTVRLDKFVYNPNRGTGTVVVNATRGAYRFITGVQDARSYEIKTPYATLGVRGTVLEIVIQEPVRTGQRQRARRTDVRR
jgi:hypothetical protein